MTNGTNTCVNISLAPHQVLAINQLDSGKILCAGVGTGKTRTALAYFYKKERGGDFPIDGNGEYKPMDIYKKLYIITTAKKRDSRDWETEAVPFGIVEPDIVVDSWNNIEKYKNVKDAFFIFDEQRVVGSGKWAKTFVHIAKRNRWILLTATPGDTWLDYIPVFIANGFYKNRTEFVRRHVIFSPYTPYPQVTGYLEASRLIKLKEMILVNMDFIKPMQHHEEMILCDYDIKKYKTVLRDRWDYLENKPVENISRLCSLLRRICSTDASRISALKKILSDYPRVIVFYNFDYELDILRSVCKSLNVEYGELNGHKHDEVPEGDCWIYLVQYAAGAEAWNCIRTNAMVFYSDTYSYKTLEQAKGRISRMNSPYSDLYYYHLVSDAPIERAIQKCLKQKKNFNESNYFKSLDI